MDRRRSVIRGWWIVALAVVDDSFDQDGGLLRPLGERFPHRYHSRAFVTLVIARLFRHKSHDPFTSPTPSARTLSKFPVRFLCLVVLPDLVYYFLLPLHPLLAYTHGASRPHMHPSSSSRSPHPPPHPARPHLAPSHLHAPSHAARPNARLTLHTPAPCRTLQCILDPTSYAARAVPLLYDTSPRLRDVPYCAPAIPNFLRLCPRMCVCAMYCITPALWRLTDCGVRCAQSHCPCSLVHCPPVF